MLEDVIYSPTLSTLVDEIERQAPRTVAQASTSSGVAARTLLTSMSGTLMIVHQVRRAAATSSLEV
jgi:hypothetical protein